MVVRFKYHPDLSAAAAAGQNFAAAVQAFGAIAHNYQAVVIGAIGVWRQSAAVIADAQRDLASLIDYLNAHLAGLSIFVDVA
ncbi:hypothetical protein D3C78_1920410 [compost metagenome]